MSAIDILRDQLASLSKLSEETDTRLRAFDANFGKHPQMSHDEESAIVSTLEDLANKLATEVSDLKARINYYDEYKIFPK